MKKRAPNAGDLIRAGIITLDDVKALAAQIFDGKRSLPAGKQGVTITLQKHEGLTAHLQMCLVTMLLTSEAKMPEGQSVDIPDDPAETSAIAAE